MTTTMTDLQTGRTFVFNEALPGRDAYEEALAQGFVGDRDAWLAHLRGFMFNPASPDWEVDRTYQANEAVRHANKLWVAAAEDTGTVPGTDGAAWVLLLDGPDPGDVASIADDAAVIVAAADRIATDLQTSTTLLGDVEAKRTEVEANRALTYGYAQDVASAIVYQNLASIAASKAVTAVDVFVYDTTRDSDGGAWRNRCHGKSWYTETLNTATRGARREFPAMAVIVAESNKVTIYDGDDPALPMWMVFQGDAVNGNSMLAERSFGTYINALNGELVAGCPQYDAYRIRFLADEGLQYGDTASISGKYKGTISQRNDFLGYNTGIGVPTIASRVVNDVAMTVLPGAPTDPATGLPVPTIAVATAGGVSVIASSGAVYDSSKTTACTNVVIDQDGKLRATFSDATSVIYDLTAIAADGFTGTTLTTSSTPAILGTATKSANAMLGSTSGITLLAAGGWGSARITTTYNTGWMPGAIKGAWLASKNTASLVGSGELVTNGTFDTDTSGWIVVSGDETLSVVDGRLRVTFGPDGLTGTGLGASQEISGLVVGATYALRVGSRLTGTNGAVGVRLLSGPITGPITGLYGFADATNEVVFFTAPSPTLYLNVYGGYGTPGTYVEVDDISIRLADADRSVNNKGLTVNGTITRTAVASGAELVGYSGFSAANYLSQAYNSALDFGTGDFCVMGWAKSKSTIASTQSLLSIDDGAGNFLRLGRASSGGVAYPKNLYLSLYGSGIGFIHLAGGIAGTEMSAGLWCFVCLTRESGVTKLWFNGVAAMTSEAAYDAFVTPASVLKFGTGFDVTSNEMAMALWRITGTVPTADQIAQIYRDEAPLFQPNAACTLYGASDAVTALASDPDTGLLHVGTSGGRSTFKGLSRIANTTTAITTAIAASGDLIVEQ